jgi:hypothetical protein
MTDPMEPEESSVEQPVPDASQAFVDEILAALVDGEREGLPLYEDDSRLEWDEDPDEQIQGDIHVGDEDESGDDLAEDEVDDGWLDSEDGDSDEEEPEEDLDDEEESEGDLAEGVDGEEGQ